MSPAKSARRLLLGTGLGLLMASGLGLISGVLSIDKPELSITVPIIGLMLLALAGPTGRGEGPLSSWFPDENDVSMAARIEEELIQTTSDADIGNAWAKLEHTMLSKELEEE
ncbi:MAG: hypothetical protein CMA11_03035 [Euryarchaeota archaeon]|nr:hypothetical protein [Euryarchaeota archaeon]